MPHTTREIQHPRVPTALPIDPDSKPERDDEKGGRPTIEQGNRDRGPAKPHEDRSS